MSSSNNNPAHKVMILSTAYCCTENGCLVAGDEHALRTRADSMLKCRARKRQETEWRFFVGGNPSPNILRSIEARKMNWQNNVSCMRYRTGHISPCVVNLTATDHAGGLGVDGCDIIKMQHGTF